jgi:hypothetical protein
MKVEDTGRGAWRLGAIEIATGFVVAALFVWSCTSIKVNSLVRMGQVSGIAAIELRVLYFGLPILVGLILAAKLRGGRAYPIAARLACAALAGMSSAAVAGGVLVALGRSPYGLGGIAGDSGILISWAEYVKQGSVVSPVYPPLQTQLLAWISQVLDIPTHYAMKVFQVLGIAVVGPLAYAAWRLLLSPGWALGVGIVASLPLVEAYRQYPLLVLVLFIPLLVKFLDVLRRSPALSLGRILQSAVWFGLALGILFLLYSGWYQWSAPGFVVAAAIVFPWRSPKHAAVLCGVALVVFLLVTFQYLTAVIEAPKIKDDYVYFDAFVEPAYVAMWRGGLPGNIGVWPPIGELAGVGLFTVLLAVGVGASVALGRTHTVVIGVGLIMLGTWLFRFWHAKNMYQTKLVQLYPRTTAELLYCALVLALFAIYLVLERMRTRAPEDSPLRAPSSLIGVCAGFLLLLVSTSAATTDKYMPKEAFGDPGHMAWLAQRTPKLEESQALYATFEVSSSDGKSSPVEMVDRKPSTFWSSKAGPDDREEWVVLKLPSARDFKSIVLHPAPDGFPVEVAVELWNGAEWLPRIKQTYATEPRGPQTLLFPQMEGTDLIRVRAPKLRKVGDNYVLRFAEIELYR